MKDKKRYSTPEIFIVKVDTESLLTTFSNNGTIEGPAGVRPNNFNDEWEEYMELDEL